MHWSADYIGLPWQVGGLTRDGIACWGLARLVYAEQLGIAVPDYAAAVPSLEERAEIAAIFAEATSTTGPWLNVGAADAAEFDILVFRRAGLAHHVGIAIWRRPHAPHRYGPGQLSRRLHDRPVGFAARRGLCAQGADP